MKVVIRADASLQIGTGHIMRCLTLADALRDKGAQVFFICRKLQGNLISFVESKKYQVYQLEQGNHLNLLDVSVSTPSHYHWLEASVNDDVQACRPIMHEIQPDWLIMDHYALDYQWQDMLKEDYLRLMVIDDLADRKHHCDLLLDQTFGRNESDYINLVPERCVTLLGSEFALLRPEFAQWREFSLKRRVAPTFNNLLITMGGADSQNFTAQILETLKKCDLPANLTVTVIMGALSPHRASIGKFAQELPFTVDLLANVENMAEILSKADLTIGAAGSTTWERCCLGVPTVLITLAENQQKITDVLFEAGVAERVRLENLNLLGDKLSKMRRNLHVYSEKSQVITDGKGVDRVVKVLETIT